MSFLKSKALIINSVIAVAVLLILYFIFVSTLDSYTQHAERVEVPDLTGLTVSDAKELAQQSNLKVIVSDTTYSTETRRGLIAAQNPVMSSFVKSNRTIYLTINSMAAEMVVMPNFVGASLRQAVADAEIYALNIGEITYKPDLAKNNVLEQKVNGALIEAGVMIEKWSYVDLTLGMGLSNEKVYIPLLLNKKIKKADSLLKTKFLNRGALFYDSEIKTVKDSLNAFVYKQQPEPFSRNFKPGDYVDLWFTIDSTKVSINRAWQDSASIKNLDIDKVPVIAE